jgi:hypothetical protein
VRAEADSKAEHGVFLDRDGTHVVVQVPPPPHPHPHPGVHGSPVAASAGAGAGAGAGSAAPAAASALAALPVALPNGKTAQAAPFTLAVFCNQQLVLRQTCGYLVVRWRIGTPCVLIFWVLVAGRTAAAWFRC